MSTRYERRRDADKRKYDLIGKRINELNGIVLPAKPNSTQVAVLHKTVEVLTGEVLPMPELPLKGQFATRQEMHSETERARRRRYKVAYDALEKWILANELSEETRKMGKLRILNITLEHLRLLQEVPVPGENPSPPANNPFDVIMNIIANNMENFDGTVALIQTLIEETTKKNE